MTDRLLKDLYYTPGLPTTFGSAARLWKTAKRANNTITKKHVDDWLLAQDAYTLHKKARRKLSAEPRIYVRGIDEQWSMDLCDVSNISEYNNDVHFILTVIDVFSKRADAEPVKRKSAANVVAAVRNVFMRTNRRPEQIDTDHGKEFWNAQFKQLCQQENIHHFSTQSSNKAAVVERFNRSLKELMYKMFSAHNSYRWLELLPLLLKTYNSRYHRSIGRNPDSVSAGNEKEVYRHLYRKQRHQNWGKKYKAGDLVRISRKRHIFEKGYLPQFTEEIFKISKVISNHYPHRYEIEDMAGEHIAGTFASEELQKVIKDNDNLWKIEKIIRQLKRHGETLYLVKWRGFPPKFNSLVRSENLVQISPDALSRQQSESPTPSEEL